MTDEIRQRIQSAILQLTPNDASTRLKLGDALRMLGDPDAIRLYESAAEIYARDGRHSKADAVYKYMRQLGIPSR